MKKIDQLFHDFPELKIIQTLIIKGLERKNNHPIQNIYKRYPVRKPKHADEALHTLKTSEDDQKKALAQFYIEHHYWGTALFYYINSCFKLLKNNPSITSLLTTLKNPPQFYHTLSEIEFNAYFSIAYSPTIKPKIHYSSNDPKELDSKITFDKRPCYFEILTPEASKGLFTKPKKEIFMKPRVKGKIMDKLQKQLFPLKDVLNSPVVIVINRSYTDIDDIEIKNSLLGESQATIVYDNMSRKVVQSGWTRANNSIFHKDSNSNLISAVLFYKRNIYLRRMQFEKKIIMNSNAKYPLTPDEHEVLNKFDLREIIKL